MKIKDFIIRANKNIDIKTVIIWNPFISKALFVGTPQEIPESLNNKNVTAYRYDKNKYRMIIRINSQN